MSASTGGPITVAIVGLGFGQDFIPIYLSHPGVERVVLVEPDAARRADVTERFGIEDGYGDIQDALADDTIDAIHILAPVFLHADMAVAALEAGKHVACAVPMATTLDDLDRVIAAQEFAGTVYMMMETAVFGREFYAVEELWAAGEFGEPTLYRGFHMQNLDGYPVYWQGFPPMHYLTHALSPLLALFDTSVDTVRCLGAGRLPEWRRTGKFDNPFPTEVGLFNLRDSDVVADITMSFFQTAHSYIEGFALFGDRLGIEWPPDNESAMTVHRMSEPLPGTRGNHVQTEPLNPRDRPELLPEPLRQFVRETKVHLEGMPRAAIVGAHHGGSHPFLVHEFVSSIVEGRAPSIDARRSAELTAPGICAHESAMAGGREVVVPRYRS